MALTKTQLLAEIEDVIRSTPLQAAFEVADPNAISWLGRASATIARWSVPHTVSANGAIRGLTSRTGRGISDGLIMLSTLLFQARADLRMEVGQVSVVVQQGQVFDYFEELRRLLETARSEVLFVDAYLDAEFVPRYLPHLAKDVAVRLLGGPVKMPTLLPAVELFAKQSGTKIEVRSSTGVHDRYLFVDKATCYLSGASFKDGAKNAPAVITQITDGFKAMWDTYDQAWSAAKIER